MATNDKPSDIVVSESAEAAFRQNGAAVSVGEVEFLKHLADDAVQDLHRQANDVWLATYGRRPGERE
jgi:hypothetical protein